ncbi:unnamed protein product, partial [marine sediment metagenome]
ALTGCTFSANSADEAGGGIYFENSKFFIANSVTEFSDIQGEGNWYYGYYDGDSAFPYSNNDFAQFPNYGITEHGGFPEHWYIDDSLYWTALWENGGHTNAAVDNSGGILDEEHWAVRRWVSGIEGQVRIAGNLAKIHGGYSGDGIMGYILVDGDEVWSQYIAGYDTVGVNYSVNVAVNIVSLIDFAIAPNGNS